MFERLKLLYDQGKINEMHLTTAVSRGWITEEEKQTIIGG